jgi:DNA-binding NtrC family response regulator
MGNQGRILFVDGGSRIPESLAAVLGRDGRDVYTVSGVQAALEPLQAEGVDAVVFAMDTSEDEGMRFLRAVEGLRPGLPVIVIIGDGVAHSPADLVRAGAYGCLMKPVSPETLAETLGQALSRGVPKEAVESTLGGFRGSYSFDHPLGVSVAWREIERAVANAAEFREPVLVLGEPGAGKGAVARMLHRSSERVGGPFIRVNCATLAVDSFEAGFTTHRQGPRAAAVGFEEVFRGAGTGSIYLDGITLLPTDAQDDLIRLVRSGSAESAAAQAANTGGIRVISSSSVDLEAAVAAGDFRRDLFTELSKMTIIVPPLRDRVEDIGFLAGVFLAECAIAMRKPARAIHPAAAARLQSYRWPGNVRELRNVVERAVLLSETEEIPAAMFPLDDAGDASAEMRRDLNLRSVLAAEEKKTLVEALKRANGVRRQAARLLGIDPRNLVYFLRKYGLEKREDR